MVEGLKRGKEGWNSLIRYLRLFQSFMYLNFDIKDNILIVNLRGELDHNSAEELRVKVDNMIDSSSIENIILNFSGVSFMDSSGIGAVIGRYKKIKLREGNLVVTNVSKNVSKIFEMSGLYKIIKKYDTVSEAAECM